MATNRSLAEIFADSDSESSFSGFSDQEDPVDQENLENENDRTDNNNNNIPSGYSHEWLGDFDFDGTGPCHLPDDPTEYDIMKLFITDEFVDLCVRETNRYANNFIQTHTLSQYSRAKKWQDVSFEEMNAVLALLLLTGISKRSSYELYWSTDSLIEMKGFREIMPRDRFLAILNFLHLVNNDENLPRDHPNHDKAFKIRPLVDLLVPLWQRHYKPKRELSIDESMIPFKGRTCLMQYMPAKPNKWGLKAWGLAEAKTGYIYNWQLYLGKDSSRPTDLPLAHHVVMTLAEPLFDKGHILYMDNFFSSPALFKDLADKQMGACGTLRSNRRGVPATIQQAKPTAGNPPITDTDDKILYISWFDKKVVNLITTVHSSETYRKLVRSKKHPDNVREVDKPCAIQAYSQHMGGIDRADKAMTFYMVLHRCCKWWKKVFFYLLEVCFCNALVIWKAHVKKRVDAETFRLRIVHGMLRGYQRRTDQVKHGNHSGENAGRLVADMQHCIGLNPNILPSGRRSRPDCAVCSDRASHNRCQTQFICKKCNKSMCPYPCFERYHTLVEYEIKCSKTLHQE